MLKGILMKQITTDRQTHIRKYMKDEKSEKTYQFEVWHFAKITKKKLLAASQKRLKFLRNGLSLFQTIFGGPVGLKKETYKHCMKNGYAYWLMFKIKINNWETIPKMWASSLNKVIKAKEWLTANSETFKALHDTVTYKIILNDLIYISLNFQTRELYHALYNKWISKSQNFFNLRMVT